MQGKTPTGGAKRTSPDSNSGHSRPQKIRKSVNEKPDALNDSTSPTHKKRGSSFKYKYVIIGGGNAAGYAAKAFVDSGKLASGELCIIGKEPILPYERPALTKRYMRGKAKLPGFNTCAFFGRANKHDWYEKHGIVLMLDTTVSTIDVKTKIIQTEDFKEIEYQKCLAATGARSVRLSDFKLPGSDMEGLFYVRSHWEAQALLKRLEMAESSEEVVIIGGGYIGMEMAAAVLHHGLTNITIVFPEQWIIERVFPSEVAQVYEDAFTARGMKFLKNAKRVTGFERKAKTGKVDFVCLNDGQKLPADLVIVGVGAYANAELFKGQVKMEHGGIKVDGQMRSSADDLWACGDVATFPIIAHGETRRLEHVRAARATAMHAARSMLKLEQEDIDFLPVFYSRMLDFQWEFLGKRSAKYLLFGFGANVEKKFGCVWVTDDDRLCGVFLEGGSTEDKKHIAKLARSQEKLPIELLKPEAARKLMSYVLA